jgi:hypothetical protein
MCWCSTNWKRAGSQALPSADCVQILNAALRCGSAYAFPNLGSRLWTMPALRTSRARISRSIVPDRLCRALGTASTLCTGFFG